MVWKMVKGEMVVCRSGELDVGEELKMEKGPLERNTGPEDVVEYGDGDRTRTSSAMKREAKRIYLH